jgi:CRP-like cAMP-binding protein
VTIAAPPRRARLLCGTIAAVETNRIAAVPIFADLPAAELDELAAAMSELEVDAGTNVVTVDDYGDAIYFIEEGEADVVTDSGDPSQPLGRGDAFGEIGLLLTGERTATIVSRTPMRLLSLSGPSFERIRERVPGAEGALRRLGLERASR